MGGVREPAVDRIVRSPANDGLQERRRLEVHIRELLDAGKIEVFTGITVDQIRQEDGKLIVQSASHTLSPVDRIIAATGFRPNPNLLAELRTSLDPSTASPTHLAPLIDSNLHSCGSVPAHGAAELAHPERGLYIVGIKNYGRAPTFLLKTGYLQIKSVVSALASPEEQQFSAVTTCSADKRPQAVPACQQ